MAMPKGIGVILTDNYSNSELNPFSKFHSVSYLNVAEQKIIDFSLKNMMDANLESIGILCCRNSYLKLRTHLSLDERYRKDLSDKKIVPIPNFTNSEPSALSNLLKFIQNTKSKNVVICESNLITNLDISNILSFHESHKSSITAVYSPKCRQLNSRVKSIIFDIDNSGKISDIKIFPQKIKGKNVSLNIYVVDRNLLVSVLEDCIENGLNDLIVRLLLKNLCVSEIQSYKHDKFAHRIDNIEEYYKFTMKILSDFNAKKVNSVYKKLIPNNHNSKSVKYGKNAKIKESIIANDCNIDGQVENSVIFKGVSIQKNSLIKNSIIMQDGFVGENCVIENAILNSDVTVDKSKKLVGNNERAILVNQEVV